MAVNQQNVSVVHNFGAIPPNGGPGVGIQYEGPAGVMPGGPTFVAAVLCRVRNVALGVVQTLFSNFDLAAFSGFDISVAGTADPGRVTLAAAVGDGLASIALTADLGPGPKDKLMLLQLVSDGVVANGYRLYVNGSLVAFATLVNAGVASALQPRIGGFDAAGTNAATLCDVAGVAYGSSAASEAEVGAHFNACHRAMAMAKTAEYLNTPDFTNRFDVREGAVVAGAQGTVVGGNLTAFPGAAATWAPSAGTAVLTRLGPDPFTSGNGVRTNVITNPVWAWADVPAPPPQ